MAIASELFPDNDAAITVTDLPTGLTVNWLVAATNSPTATAINGALSGFMTEDPATAGRYTATVQGADITTYLVPTYTNQTVYVIIKVGQDVRVSMPTVVRASRTVVSYLGSADLLARCKRVAQLPAIDESMPDSTWYDLLTEAQHEWIMKLAARFPHHFYGAPTKLTTADGGKTYTYGVGPDGSQTVPFGHVELFAMDGGRPMYSTTYESPSYDGFLFEGAVVRMPRNKARVFANGPWARFVTEPFPISATMQPDARLRPSHMRMLLVYEAVLRWASQGGEVDPSPYVAMLERTKVTVYEMLATQYSAGGTAASSQDWWLAWWQTAGPASE